MTTTLTNQCDTPRIDIEIDQTPANAKCLDCGREFQTRVMRLYDRTIIPSLCDPCADLRDGRICEWVQLCPFEFRLAGGREGGGNTRIDKMTANCPEWAKVLDWKFGHRGLLIRGETGRCKTRAMWRLLRRLFQDRLKVIALTSAQFDRQCRDAGGNFTLSEWFDRLATADALFLDDIGKANWTQASEAQIFDLIDTRTREGRPILATTNDSGATLAARLSSDRAEPLVRRLRDYCDVLVF